MVFAAATFVDTVVTILSIFPVTWSLDVCKLYNPEDMPVIVPLL